MAGYDLHSATRREARMGDVIIFSESRFERDGGKTRIRKRRVARSLSEPFTVDDLVMDRADPADTAPCELCGQTGDCA